MSQGKFSIADIDQPTAPAAASGKFRLEDVDTTRGSGGAEVTPLTPPEEQQFQQWTRANGITDVDAPESRYDYRGYWKEHGAEPIRFGVDHFPDTYKQHGHPTFSVESKYSVGPNDGGRWQGETFIPPRAVAPPGPETTVSGGMPGALAAASLDSAIPPDELDIIARSAPVQQSVAPEVPLAQAPPPVIDGGEPRIHTRGRFSGLPGAPAGPPSTIPEPLTDGMMMMGQGAQHVAQGLSAPPDGVQVPSDLEMQSEVVRTPLPGEVKQGVSELIEGAFTALSPMLLPAFLAGPVTTAIGLGTAILGQKAAELGVKKLGGTDEDARLAGNVVAAAIGAGAGDLLVQKARAKVASAAVDARAAMEARAAAADAARTITPDPNVIDLLPTREALPETATTPAPIEGRPIEPPAAPQAEPVIPPAVSIEPSPVAAPAVSETPMLPGLGQGGTAEAVPAASTAVEPQGQFSSADIDVPRGTPDTVTAPTGAFTPADVEPEAPREFASTQIALPADVGARLQELGRRIPDEDLAADGRETDPHITLKYGLHGNDPAAVRELLANEPPIQVTLGKTSIFPNGESNSGDVVKVDVDSADLHRLNTKIAAALEHTDTFPDYQPHATVAYVKPGLGAKYADDASLEGQTFTVDRVTFSGTNDELVDIPLGGRTINEDEHEDAAASFLARFTPDEYAGMGYIFESLQVAPPTYEDVRDGYAAYLRKTPKVQQTVGDFAQDLARGRGIAPAYLRELRADAKKPVTPQLPLAGGEKPSGAQDVVAVQRAWADLKRPPQTDAGLSSAVPEGQSDAFYRALITRYGNMADRAAGKAKNARTSPADAAQWTRIAAAWQQAVDRANLHFENAVSGKDRVDVEIPLGTKSLPSSPSFSTVEEPHGRAETVTPVAAGPLPGHGDQEHAEADGQRGQPESRRARVRRRRAERQADEDAALDEVITQAQAGGHTGDAEVLRTELRIRLQAIRDIDAEFSAAGRHPDVLLREIAKRGGIGDDPSYPGEIKWLRELRDQQPSKSRKNLLAPPVVADTVRGIAGVFRRGGMTLGETLEHLSQDPRFSHIQDVNDLVDELRLAATATPEKDAVARLIKGLGEKWWERVGTATPSEDDGPIGFPDDEGGDISFDPAELDALPAGESPDRGETLERVDTLDMGESQPRLPEAGAVRDTDIKTPEFDAPFSLNGEADTTPRERPRDLFDGKKPSGGSGGGRESMAGLFSEAIPEPAVGAARPPQLVEFPELVALARELAQTPSVVKAFRSPGKRGDLNTLTGQIRLTSELFKAGQERQLAATLAHEIGHLVDWLPHRTLKRGNILGRLYSLRSFLKHTFIAPDGSEIRHKEVRAELTALSNAWRPWDPATASPSFAAYRKSSKEIFADAISVLLNDPGLLQKDAPIFYDQFFAALDHKPEVKQAYFGLQELLSGTPEELIARRRAGVREMFAVGDTTAMDLERLRQAEQVASRKDLALRARIQFVDKNTPLIDRVKQLEKQGVRINPDDDPRYFLEERNYLGGKLKAFVERHFQPIYQTLLEHDVDWHTFGEMLFYERIASGDRSELANPRGITPTAATDLAAATMRAFTPAQRTVVRDSLTAFRAAVRGVAGDAHDAGLYTDALHAQMQENPAYAAFRVIDHLEDHVTSRVHRQIGTLKDVTNPADASMLKTLVTIRAIEQQKMKVATFDFLTEHYPGDIAQAKEIGSAKGPRPIEPKDRTKQQLITYFEKGNLRGKYVDPYIADSLTNASVGHNFAVVQALRAINSGVFRPLFTTLNLGFQTFNAGRDFLRFWKNTPTMTLARAAKRYRQAVPMARVRAWGLPESATFAQRQATKDLQQAGDAKILSVTYNDLINGRVVEDTQIEDTLSKMGIGGFGIPTRTGLAKVVGPILDWIKASGDFIETLPKAAALHEFKGTGTIAEIPADTRSFIRRKVGSPDFLAGGTWKPVTNEVFLFSNAITQAIRSDFEVATEPTTRAGFWWKTAALNVAPKLALFALLATAFLDDDDKDGRLARLRRIVQGMSEYDLTNYNNVPLGLDAKGHAVYVRLPQDDFGRLIGGLTWKALQLARGDKDALKSAMQVFDYMAGQVPSVTPIFEAIGDAAQFAAGQNVHDSFRNRFLFTDDELKAGGWPTAKKFLGYEFQQLGGGIAWKFYAGEQRPRDRTTGQTILDFPIVSNIVGRWIKITNFGEVERLREAQSDVQAGEARTRQAERAAVNDALRTYQALPKVEQTFGKQAALARAIVADLYPKERQGAELRDVLAKIRMGLVRGHADALTDTVLSATSNAQKVAVIVKAADGLSDQETREWLRRAVQEHVVSSDVYGQVQRRLWTARRSTSNPTPQETQK